MIIILADPTPTPLHKEIFANIFIALQWSTGCVIKNFPIPIFLTILYASYDVPYYFVYISAPSCCTEMGLNLVWNIPKEGCIPSSKMVIARKIMNKSWRYHISRYQIIHHFKFLKSDTPYHFAYISASQYGTEMFLYSRQSYKSHLSNEICLSHLACL